MPPAALHCLTHLTSAETLKERFPAIYHVKFSDPNSPEHYGLWSMMLWATVPYTLWQLNYHYFITVRRSAEIAAGFPTSFTWLRKSYRNNLLGKMVLGLPDSLQEPAFMLIQYLYAILTMIPCPIWFWSKIGSSLFLSVILTWSVYNGATFYIDVFGKRFQKELEQLRRNVAQWQASPEFATSPIATPVTRPAVGVSSGDKGRVADHATEMDKANLDRIPPLDATTSTIATGVGTDKQQSDDSTVRGRK